MRVLAMFHAYVPTHGAGAETMAHALLRHLVRQGHEVDVILSRVDDTVAADYTYEGVRVHTHTGKTQTPDWLSGDHRPHVIVCHLQNTPRAAILGKMFGIPVVQLLHNHLPATLHSTVRHDFALLVVNTAWMADEYVAHWREVGSTKDPRVIQVHPPVFVEDYDVVAKARRGDCITLVNLTVEKGAHVFYALAERLPHLNFLGVRGAYGIQAVRQDLPNVTIAEHVLSHSMATEVYAHSRIVLMPSDYESYGRVAVEASSCGIPVIAHPTAGLREALGPSGIFCDRGDIESWSHQIRRLQNARHYKAAATKARHWAETLDPTSELELWHTAIQEVASVPAAARHR